MWRFDRPQGDVDSCLTKWTLNNISQNTNAVRRFTSDNDESSLHRKYTCLASANRCSISRARPLRQCISFGRGLESLSGSWVILKRVSAKETGAIFDYFMYVWAHPLNLILRLIPFKWACGYLLHTKLSWNYLSLSLFQWISMIFLYEVWSIKNGSVNLLNSDKIHR